MPSNTEEEYTAKEQEEIIEECLKANKLHLFMKKERKEGGRLSGKDGWMDDAERFLYFSYVEAKAMNKHSKHLTCLTIALLIFALVQIVVVIMTATGCIGT